MHATPRPLAALGLIAVLLAACSNSASASPTAQPAGPPGPSPIVGPSPSVPVAQPSGVPVSTPLPSVAPTPVPSRGPVAWSRPFSVPGLEGCGGLFLAIDATGTSHLAATCDVSGVPEVRYASSTDGVHWTTATFARPAHTAELNGEIAIDGSTLYVASTRQVLADGGCGDDGMTDAGVFIRTRTLPGGTWSAPVRIGQAADALQSLRVANGVIHATVTSDDGARTWYERGPAGGTAVSQRVQIGDAAGAVSLRVGDDGIARIAYEGSGGIHFGTVNGQVSAATIPNSANGFDPIFVVEPGNVADVLWNRGEHGPGCAGAGSEPEDGTYFATNAGGSWKTTRLSKAIGASSVTTDPATGDLVAVIQVAGNPVIFRSSDRSSWTHEILKGGDTWAQMLRVSSTTGQWTLAYVADPSGAGPTQVVVRTKG